MCWQHYQTLCQKSQRATKTVVEIEKLVKSVWETVQMIRVFIHTMVLTGTICGTICEDSSPLKCASVAPFQIHTTTSSRRAWLQVPHCWRTNRKDHPVTDKLPCCYHCWPYPTDLNGVGAVIFILKSTQWTVN